ncbi:MAG: multidrug effflux MFS transporter [Microlunatus sp.]
MSETSTPSRSVATRSLPILLLLLTTFGPISMDLYLPALPALTRELEAATSISQLTVTACLIGLAAGQLISGPISDQYGRRRILLVGVIAYIVMSILCAVSPSIEVLIAVRFVQGLAGGVGIVIAQAAGRDVFDGTELIRFYGRLAVTGSMAAIVGPMLGGFLNAFVDWRGLFVFLAILGVLILIAVLVIFRETLPVEQRSSGGFAQTLRDFRTLAGDRVFVGAVLNQGFMYAAVFAYLAGSTFVPQDIYGLSPQWYAACFALNNVGGVLAGWLGGRLSERWSIVGTLVIGIVIGGLGSLGLLFAGLVPVPVGVVIAALFLLAFGVLISGPPATTLALAEYPQMAGTAGSVLGTVRFGFGGVSAPLVGVAGSLSILPLGLVTTISVVLAGAVCLLLRGRQTALA